MSTLPLFHHVAQTGCSHWILAFKAAKECLCKQFQQWYADKICSQLEDNAEKTFEVDLRMSIVKPLSIKWMVGVCNYLKSQPDIIRNGFKEAGLSSSY